MRSTVLLILITIGSLLKAQNNLNMLNYGLEYDFYPAGHLIGVQAEKAIFVNSYRDAFINPHHTMNARIGINLAHRGNLSSYNDYETGWGPGMSLGYRYYLSKFYRAGYGGVYTGIRCDLWQLKINWEDAKNNPSYGTSKTTVLQPTLELGYKYQMRNYALSLGLVNGLEINTITDGEEVGQGWITEAQLIIARRLQ